MFQAWAVNTRKTEAHSAPSSEPGNKFRKKTKVKVRKPSTGTDCSTSSAGTTISAALRLLAASEPTTKVKIREQRIAANMRSVVSTA